MKRFFRVLILLILIVTGVWWLVNHSDHPINGFLSKSRPTITASSSFTPATTPPLASKDTPLLAQVNHEYVRVSQAVIPSVVNIIAYRPATPAADFGEGSPFILPFPFNSPNSPQQPSKPGAKKRTPTPQKEPSLGSGVIISHEGHIITNTHVVKDATDISVYLHDNRRFKARLIANDELADIAILKIEAGDLQPLAWGDSSKVQIGEQVFAVGNPFGLSESVSLGIVSAKGRNPSSLTTGPGSNSYEDFIQTTAAINPGNSGGALVNIQGELIGINTAIQSTSRGFQGIGFAIPSNLARFAFEGLLKNGRVTRGYLGVTIQDVGPSLPKFFQLPNEFGALITAVEPKSPAGKAGLATGDVIVSFEDRKVSDPAELRLAVSQTPIGKEVTVGVIRDGKPLTVTAKITELTPDLLSKQDVVPDEPPPQSEVEQLDNLLGALQVEDLNNANRRANKLSPSADGVLVTAVEEGSVAETEGVRPGDLIEQIRVEGQFANSKITDVKSYYTIARRVKKDQSVLLLLRRGRSTTFIALTPE